MSGTADNIYSGGLSFNEPVFQLGAMNGATINGGLSFDLPLATVAHFNDQALNFTAQQSAQRTGFLGTVFQTSQNNVSDAFAQVMRGLGNDLSTIQNISAVTSSQQFTLGENITQSRSSGCYITTAICESRGLLDNCEELRILRRFRDTYMMRETYLCQLVGEYYREAPTIVARLKSMPDHGFAAFEQLRDYLYSCIYYIRSERYVHALLKYISLVHKARELAGLT